MRTQIRGQAFPTLPFKTGRVVLTIILCLALPYVAYGEDDRGDSSGAAAGLAAMGAAMSGAACMMLIREGMKKKDNTLIAMGMQQCAQAAQSAAAGAQNSKSKDKIQNAEPAAAPQLADNRSSTPAPENAPFQITESTPSDSNDTNDPITVPSSQPVAIDTSVPQPTIADNGDTSDNETGNPAATTKATNTASTTNAPTGSQLQFDDKGASNLPPITTFAGSNGLVGKTDGVSDLSGSATDAKSKRRKPSSEDYEGGASGGDEGGGGKSADPFDSMLSQLLGGGGAGGETRVGGNGDIILLSGAKKNGERGMNIFEFASDQYQVAAYHSGRVRLAPKPKEKPGLAHGTAEKRAAVTPALAQVH